MTQATLSVTMPDHLWIQQISTEYPNAQFRVVAAVPGADRGFALVRIDGPDVDGVLAAMEAHPQLTELSLAQRSENEATVHFETTAPLLLFSSRESGMPIELPVEIQNGDALIDVTGSRQRLSDLVDQLAQFGLEYRVEHIRERVHDSQLLSDRQREVIVAAVDRGYYDTPRRCSLTELADQLGIAKSTCSETLHRAEESVIKRYVDGLPTTIDDGRLEEELVS